MSTKQHSASAKPNASKRGQLFTIDLMMSIGVYLAAFFLMYYTWTATQSQLLINFNDLEMSKVALGVSDSLLSSAGQDSNWDTVSSPSISAYGASWRRNVLVQHKIAGLQALLGYNNSTSSSYRTAKEKLGSGRYELYISMQNISGTPIYELGLPAPQAVNSWNRPDGFNITRYETQLVQRVAILNNTPMIVRVEIWKYLNQE